MYEDIKHTYIKYADDTYSEGKDDITDDKHRCSNLT